MALWHRLQALEARISPVFLNMEPIFILYIGITRGLYVLNSISNMPLNTKIYYYNINIQRIVDIIIGLKFEYTSVSEYCDSEDRFYNV